MSTVLGTNIDDNVQTPKAYLNEKARSELNLAVSAQQQGSKVFESLQNLNEVIGTEYGNRVLYELIQNAHDAHDPEDEGRIAINLIVQSNSEGVLYIANGGNGFREEDVEAIRNLATSGKEVGAGIGNKGLGFRSIEAITDNVQIYSRKGKIQSDRFDGFCFRFASTSEIEKMLISRGIKADISQKVARTIPRYLIPRALEQQPDEVIKYAENDYATVVVAPLCTEEAVQLVTNQIKALCNFDVPLHLFLERISEIRIDIKVHGQKPYQRRLKRRQNVLGDISELAGCRLQEVNIGKGTKFLVVRYKVEKDRVLEAVRKSIPHAPQLEHWLKWKGQPIVSIAVGLSATTVKKGRLYNFLPMGELATSPLLGYLDAPFFAEIDRRNLDLDLPLNECLVELAAEACSAAVLSIVENDVHIPKRAVFDLFAWTGSQAHKLDDGLELAGSSLREAPIIPSIAIEEKKGWASLNQVHIWPNVTFSLLKAREVAKRIGVKLVSGELNKSRLERLNQIVRRAGKYSLSPSGNTLSKWSEDFARSLYDREVEPRIWSQFYEDLNLVFSAQRYTSLDELADRAILYDRSSKLRKPGGTDTSIQTGVFVRSEAIKGKRTKDGVPYPPATLSRRYRFLNEKITFQRETLDGFINAGLLREYDPLEALSGLRTALGNNANQNRRKEALLWAFRVWKVTGDRIEEELKGANLHVPTLNGWLPAKNMLFSSSWTRIGRVLENYLIESAGISSDCRSTRDHLLIDYSDWPSKAGETKKDWLRFLELIGVTDGLRPIAAHIRRSGSPSNIWNRLLDRGNEAEGLDNIWCAEVSDVNFRHPYTDDYLIEGDAWRFPGQLEYDKLSETAKKSFCILVFEHIKDSGDELFTFEVGRFQRGYSQQDRKTLPTPLATFLRSKPWIMVNTSTGADFRRANECWTTRAKRGGPPRFMDRIADTVVDFTDDKEFATMAFKMLELRDWQHQNTAVERLKDLAKISTKLSSNERPIFRKEYLRAWHDIGEAYVCILPYNLSLAVSCCSQLEELTGDKKAPPNVIITQDAQRFEARILSAAGYAVLEIGNTSVEKITELLEINGTFLPHSLDGVGVRLLIDGEPFMPTASDPFLTSFNLSWLPEVVILGYELRGEQLERSISSTTLDSRVRAIRVRQCETITLVVDDKEISPAESMNWYAFEHEELPTLILSRALLLDWPMLAKSLSGAISRMIDGRLRSLEPLLLRLAIDRTSNELEAPSDEALAKALECDIQTIQDLRAALRVDNKHFLHLLFPIVAYYKGTELAYKLISDAEQSDSKFDVLDWLKEHSLDAAFTPEVIIEKCERASDRASLRRDMGLKYKRFNEVLLELNEPPISNEAELRMLFDAYLGRMRSEIIDRLRQEHITEFRDGLDLQTYVDRKTLAFIPFNQDWVLTLETLDMEVVKAYVANVLDNILKKDEPVKLPELNSLIEKNRKSVREFAAQAVPIVQLWCRHNNVTVPELWIHDDPQSVTRYLQNVGLLDFQLVSTKQIPGLCNRVDCWPKGMPETINSQVLGLDDSEIKEEEKRRKQELKKREVAQRSINFAGCSLDTGDPSFAETFQQLIDGFINNGDWFKRSRQRPKLIDFGTADQSRSNGGRPGGTKGGKQKRRLTDVQKNAMGLASEWLAYQFLLRRHGKYFNETCWVSKNRKHFLGGDEGNDALGYDFCVKTPNVEWFYEVKSSLEDICEFELTANELHVASRASKDGRRRYRILYVPFVFSPDRWFVLDLPNPMGETTRSQFTVIGRGSVRLKFELLK